MSLEEAKQNLEETEYDRYIQDQEQMLDALRSETEEWMNSRLDDINLLIQGVVDSTNANAETIKTTLEEEVKSVGTTLTESMNAIWSTNGEFTSVVTTYGNEFNSALTTTNNTLMNIRDDIRAMVANSNEKAENEVKNPSGVEKPVETPKQESPKQDNGKQETPKSDTPTTKNITVGGKINAGSAKIYDYAGDTSGERQYFRNDPIYTVLAEKNGYLKVRYHKHSSGVTGWFKKSDVKAYKTGGLLDETGLFWGDGTKSKPEMVLDAKDTENFIELKNVLKRIDSQDLLFGEDVISSLHDSVNIFKPLIETSSLNNIPGILARPTSQDVSVQIGDIQMYGVNDPETFAAQLKHTLQTDKNITRIIQSDTLGVMTGKNTLSKFKY